MLSGRTLFPKVMVFLLLGTVGSGLGCAQKKMANFDFEPRRMSVSQVATMSPVDYSDKESMAGVAERGATPDRKLIRTATLDLLVRDLQTALNACRALATDMGGYVEQSSVSGQDQSDSRASLKLRLPSARLDEAIAALRKAALRVDSENVQVQDVTREYVDLDARLRNMQAEEQQYLAILKRAMTVKDTVEATKYLNEARGRIEQVQAQLKYMSQQVEMTSLTLNLRTRTAASLSSVTWTPALTAKNAFRDMLQGVADWADAVLSFIVELPLILLWLVTIVFVAGLLWIPTRWLWRRLPFPRWRRRGQQPEAPA